MPLPLRAGFPARLLAGTMLLLACSPAAAHVVTRGVGTAALVSIHREKISMEFDLSFSSSWGQGEMVKMDSDRDQTVSGDESRAYMLSTWTEKLAPHLELKIDGKPLALKLLDTRESNLVGEIGAVAFETFYRLEAVLPPGVRDGAGEHTLEVVNTALAKESPLPPTYYIPLSPPAPGITFRIIEPPQLLDMLGPTDVYTMVGRKLVVKFQFPSGQEPEETGKSVGPLPVETERRERRGSEEEDPFLKEVHQAFRDKQIDFWAGSALVLLAMVYGAAHAFQPGHGKTVVAAYLVGSGGKITDAILLGLATTFSHTIVVFLAGFGIHLAIARGTTASPAALQNRIFVVTSLVAGLLLFLMGLVLFFRRVRFAGDPHAMEHYYHHHHHHGQEQHHHGGEDSREADQKPGKGGRPSFWTLMGLGTTGGLVPCPSGIAIILIGLVYQKILFSLFLLVFFSLALGAVLVALGIFFVTGRKFFEGKLKSRLLTYLPSFSALFITGLGVFFMIQTFRMGRFEISVLLESLARWIRGS